MKCRNDTRLDFLTVVGSLRRLWLDSLSLPERACLTGIAFCLLLADQPTHLVSARGVDSCATLDDLTDDALAIDHEGDAVGIAEDGDKDAVLAGDGFWLVAEYGKRDPEGFGEGFVLFAAIDADAEHLCPRGFELGDISLIRLQLARSAGRPGLDVEGQDDILLATEITESDSMSNLVRQNEVGSNVANLRRGFQHGAKHQRRCGERGDLTCTTHQEKREGRLQRPPPRLYCDC